MEENLFMENFFGGLENGKLFGGLATTVYLKKKY